MGRIGLLRFGSGMPSACLGIILGMLVGGVAHSAPVNDNLAAATVLTGITNLVMASNVGAGVESGEPGHAGGPGGRSVWWSWQAPVTGTFSISTDGSNFDTLLGVYTGNSISNLQLVAANDDAEGYGFGSVISALVFRALAGETFRIAVDGFNGTSGKVQLGMGRAGYPAPAWSLLDLDGQVVTSQDFRPKVLVLDFWETICGACVDELPYLLALQQRFSPEGFTFFGVSKDDRTTDVKGWVMDNGFNYSVAMTTSELEASFGGNIALPTKFVIDRENRVVATHVGGGDQAFYESILRPLLRGSAQVPLIARRQGTNLVLAWPTTEFGYNLETTTSLGGTSWTAAPFPVVSTNDDNTVTIPAGVGSRFYRLRKAGND